VLQYYWKGGVILRFSDVNEQTWKDLRPYVDTCLLPVTGLTGSEQPWEATRALEELRDALDLFEIPYKGRVLTYPAYHYVSAEGGLELLNKLCARLKESGFPYIVVVSANPELKNMLAALHADLAFTLPPELLADARSETKQRISEHLMQLWKDRN
jgi:23S rRNA (pseudouridine1915-N3)-methyltransferase